MNGLQNHGSGMREFGLDSHGKDSTYVAY
jgi:hypothetical protein